MKRLIVTAVIVSFFSSPFVIVSAASTNYAQLRPSMTMEGELTALGGLQLKTLVKDVRKDVKQGKFLKAATRVKKSLFGSDNSSGDGLLPEISLDQR